ncbi:tetratricopeptide repeat protein [Methanospirillum hungatei]|uniref:tetratricopeptide repeat protein n=1 Tax=Methanospirillum hungatei TaxID=2203 RepID=UPI0026F33704|nr:tetratricopeptide repeat protein [Methanospirillum hungatei]MCA1916975.1 tetratricopeptide repeat protein [Methanospirillum hungatei]
MNPLYILIILLTLFCSTPGGAATGLHNPDETITGILAMDPVQVLDLFENGTFPDINASTLMEHQDLLYRKLALGLANRGDYERAESVLLSIPPVVRGYDSTLLLAFLYTRMQNPAAAMEHIVSLQVQYPDDLKLDNARAYLLCMAGSPAQARRIMEPVIIEVPLYGPFLDTWGTILAAEGRYADAEMACRKAHALMPDDAEVLAHLGMILHKSGRTADAQDVYQRSVRIDPAFGEGQKGYARVLMDLKRYAEAGKAIRAALLVMPGDSDLISWEQEIDGILLNWHIRQEQEANRPLLIKRVVPESRS